MRKKDRSKKRLKKILSKDKESNVQERLIVDGPTYKKPTYHKKRSYEVSPVTYYPNRKLSG